MSVFLDSVVTHKTHKYMRACKPQPSLVTAWLSGPDVVLVHSLSKLFLCAFFLQDAVAEYLTEWGVTET